MKRKVICLLVIAFVLVTGCNKETQKNGKKLEIRLIIVSQLLHQDLQLIIR